MCLILRKLKSERHISSLNLLQQTGMIKIGDRLQISANESENMNINHKQEER